MKKASLFLLFLGTSLSSVFMSCSDAPKEKYKSADGKFAIHFAGEPTKTTENVPTEVGNISVTMFMYEKSPKEVYIVGYSDYPSELIALSNPNDLLKGAQEGVVNNIAGQVQDEKSSDFSGHAALDFRSEGSGFTLAYKLVLVDNRLYQIGIMKEGVEIPDSEVTDFIGSFELI